MFRHIIPIRTSRDTSRFRTKLWISVFNRSYDSIDLPMFTTLYVSLFTPTNILKGMRMNMALQPLIIP
jgi:hypothetical protein